LVGRGPETISLHDPTKYSDETTCYFNCLVSLQSHGLLHVPKGQHSSSPFFANVVVPNLQTSLLLRNTTKEIERSDNAPVQNSKPSRESLEAIGAIRVPPPAYRLNIALCGFYLFPNPKEILQRVAVTDRDGPISASTAK
jgi:hypothetical protein